MLLDDFIQSGKSLIIYSGNVEIFTSEKEALEPLVEFILLEKHLDKLVIYDKYIGRAAALLMILLKPLKVYTPVISRFGKEVFDNHGIIFYAEKKVEYLMGVASDSMCKWEKVSAGKNPEEFLRYLLDVNNVVL